MSCNILNLVEDIENTVDQWKRAPSTGELELRANCFDSPETSSLLSELLKGWSKSCNEDVAISLKNVISETEERGAIELNYWGLTPS